MSEAAEVLESLVRSTAASARLLTQTRLSHDLREIVRLAARHTDTGELAESVVGRVAEAFGADGAWLRLFSDETEDSLSVSSIGTVVRDPHLIISTHIAAPQLWRDGKASVIGNGDITNIDKRLVPVDHILAFAQRTQRGSMLFIPVGAGERCSGALVLMRRDPWRAWTDDEQALAIELGRDLGAIIASIRALERERRLVAELAEIDQYRDAIIAKVAHEFEHPLSAIVDQMGILGTQVVAGRLYDRRFTGMLRRDALRMQRLIDNLLLLSQLADPNRPLNSRDVDLGPLLRRVADLLSAAIPDRHVDLRMPFDAVHVPGDPMELERLASNLLHNAMKFAPPHGSVTVSVRVLGDVVELVVADRGIGIAADELPHVFDEFYRSSDPAALVQPGAGLGLAIARRVVQRHRGGIDVVSVPGEGSTFRVTLPATSSAAAAQAGQE